MSFTKKWSSALLFMAALSQNVMADPGLELTVSGPQQVSDVNDWRVTATLKNTGDVPLDLYNDPNSVLSKTQTKTFKVRNEDGTPATFVGIAVKYRLDPDTSSFTSIPVGGSVDVTHGLSGAYQIESEGTYTITPSTTFYYAGENRQPVRIEAHLTRSITAKVAGNLKSRALEKRREMEKNKRWKRALTASTASCSSDQTAEITQSIFYASLYAASAEKYLTMHNTTSDRYEKWFGTYSSGNHDVALRHFKKIRESNVKTYNFDCSCKGPNGDGPDDPASTYAFVYPDKFGTVYLCGQYMAANVSGGDSKAGTIIHESSHFLDNAGTDDLAYGRTDAAALAAQNATAALNNADSHEYFAENVDPWLA